MSLRPGDPTLRPWELTTNALPPRWAARSLMNAHDERGNERPRQHPSGAVQCRKEIGRVRPLLVAVALMMVSLLLEGMQALTPDRHPNLTAALRGAGGALVAGLLAELFIRSRRRRPLQARKIH